jgi:O-acetyl-ADP-ribose deacetylase (regulator of RNase III)
MPGRLTRRILRWVRRTPPINIEVAYGDITTQHADVIVNAAKPSLLGGGGVDGAIHKAGGPAILAQCRTLAALLPGGVLPAGEALITTAGDLDASWVVHTVGPRYDAGQGRREVLRKCYTASLAAADVVGAKTVVFPLISAGAYGWPMPDAIVQALTAIRTADTNVQTVRLVLFDANSYLLARTISGYDR